MELQNVNHDAPSVIEAFAGTEKVDRIIDKLVELAQWYVDEGGAVSEVIQRGVELYADTTEEAIGIAMGLFNAVVTKIDPINERRRVMSSGISSMFSNRDSFSPSYFGGIEGMLKILDNTKELTKAMDEDDPDAIPDEVIRAMLKSHKDCDPDKCEIKRQGLKRGMISDGKNATKQS